MSANILKGKEFEPTLHKTSFGDFFFNRAEKYGDRICQINADLDESETYSSVKERSTRVALYLQQKGITSKDIIAFCSYNSLDNTIPIISSFYLGAKIVNLDPTISARNTKYLLTLVRPRMIFVDDESLELIESCLSDTKLDTEIVVFGKSTKYTSFFDMVLPCPNEDTFRPADVDVHDTAAMFFTSGTTGLSKAVCHSHYSFLQMIEIAHESGYQVNRVLHSSTFYWISGMVLLTRTFFNGSTRVFARSLTGESTLKRIEKYKLTSIFVPPSFTYELTSVPNLEKYDILSFTYLLTGGSALSTDQYKKVNNLFPKVQLLWSYGMTEAGMGSIFHPERDEYFLKTKFGSCGKVPPGVSLKIVNLETEEAVGPNQKGEIRLKSEALMKGYYQMDSSSSFDSDGFFKSADIGYYDEDECIYVVARMHEMFKFKNWHIVPSSIEAVLLEHPGVAEAVVFGVPKEEDGEIPAACVVLKDDFQVDKEEIEKFVEERVADREKLRGGVTFVENLPKTPSGKVIRNEVRNNVINLM